MMRLLGSLTGYALAATPLAILVNHYHVRVLTFFIAVFIYEIGFRMTKDFFE